LTTEDAIDLSIAKATAAETDAAYFSSVIQSDAYQTNERFRSAIDARIAAAQAEAGLHQEIKIAIVTLL